MKKVLVLCTGNSCRSIIAEALINNFLSGIKAYSAGIKPNKMIHPNTKKVLQNYSIWNNKYFPKHINDVIDIEFDLIITVCDNAKETCPMFPRPIKIIHIGFEDPNGKEYKEFEKTFNNIKNILLPKIQEYLI